MTNPERGTAQLKLGKFCVKDWDRLEKGEVDGDDAGGEGVDAGQDEELRRDPEFAGYIFKYFLSHILILETVVLHLFGHKFDVEPVL